MSYLHQVELDAAATVDVIYGKATQRCLLTLVGSLFFFFTCLHSEKKTFLYLALSDTFSRV
jgi:hypothetical protein